MSTGVKQVKKVDSGTLDGDGNPVLHEFTAAVEVTKPVDLESLEAEVAVAAGLKPGQVSLQSVGSAADASEDASAVVWTDSEGVEPGVLADAARKHERSEQPRECPLDEAAAQAAIERLLAGKLVDVDGLNLALRLMVRQNQEMAARVEALEAWRKAGPPRFLDDAPSKS